MDEGGSAEFSFPAYFVPNVLYHFSITLRAPSLLLQECQPNRVYCGKDCYLIVLHAICFSKMILVAKGGKPVGGLS
jgi:hypothetical protein